jgi:hypothetical protein
VRLGVLPKREAQRRAAWLGTLAQAAFGQRRGHLEGGAYSEFPHSDVGFPKGDSPEDFLANMEAFLKEGAARLEAPSPPVFSPTVMRDLAAVQEAVVIEQEVRKGEAGHPTVTAPRTCFAKMSGIAGVPARGWRRSTNLLRMRSASSPRWPIGSSLCCSRPAAAATIHRPTSGE